MSKKNVERVKCKMYCPNCREVYEVTNPILAESYTLKLCAKCSKDGEYHFEEEKF